jgi:hypothetical protein
LVALSFGTVCLLRQPCHFAFVIGRLNVKDRKKKTSWCKTSAEGRKAVRGRLRLQTSLLVLRPLCVLGLGASSFACFLLTESIEVWVKLVFARTHWFVDFFLGQKLARFCKNLADSTI